MDWLDPLAVQGTLKSLLQHHSLKVSILQISAIFIVQLSHPYMTTGKTIALTRQAFVGKAMSLLYCIHRFNQNWNFNLLLIESMNAKPADIVDKLYSLHYAILYMGLEHPQILVFAETPETKDTGVILGVTRHTRKYFSPLKTKGILTYTMWMKLEDSTLSETSQSQENK